MSAFDSSDIQVPVRDAHLNTFGRVVELIAWVNKIVSIADPHLVFGL